MSKVRLKARQLEEATRRTRAAGSALGVFLVIFFGYFGPMTIKPKTTYGWAWRYLLHLRLSGGDDWGHQPDGRPIIERSTTTRRGGRHRPPDRETTTSPLPAPRSAEDYPDICADPVKATDFDLVTRPAGRHRHHAGHQEPAQRSVCSPRSTTCRRQRKTPPKYEMLTSSSLILMPGITPISTGADLAQRQLALSATLEV